MDKAAISFTRMVIALQLILISDLAYMIGKFCLLGQKFLPLHICDNDKAFKNLAVFMEKFSRLMIFLFYHIVITGFILIGTKGAS